MANQSDDKQIVSNANSQVSDKNRKKAFAIIFSVLIAIMVIAVYVKDVEHREHTFGDITFSAPGEWVIAEESNEPFQGLPAHSITISNNSYYATIVKHEADDPISTEISDNIIDDTIKDIPNPQDMSVVKTGDLTYYGSWFEDKHTLESTVESLYVVMDHNANTYTIISFVGDKDTKDNIIDTYHSIKYKGENLYNN